MTKEEIAADRATCDAATPGPWEAHSRFDKRWPATVTKTFMPGESCFQRGGTARICADFKICWGARDTAWLGKGELDGNLDFIAAARTRWPAALDRIEQLEKEVAELRESKRLYHDRHLDDIEKITELVRQNADFRFRIADVERAAQSELLSRKAEK